ncbi:murein biosynthesis integral membrane protein MurJ [Streptomyces hoynatensis]|uniref:Murein biosynthesis integral membrane protein MurJ n=1 Tax=Streptomyces hoynatensis TaxID=1141874 RepID=A0A3A9YG99_9ACTN|nr:murein biosynthesis integral membrane protein MurJ [Streptomyces hoynatensis]RKN36032.1 murein biosynthesis integral membrane protein MurJ [Streptomyces hoynatensis]
MQAPYDRERGQAPGGGDPSGWQDHQPERPEQPGAHGPRPPAQEPGPYDGGYDPYAQPQPGQGGPGYGQGYAPSPGQSPYDQPGYHPGYDPRTYPQAPQPDAYGGHQAQPGAHQGYPGYQEQGYYQAPYPGGAPTPPGPAQDGFYDQAAHPPPYGAGHDPGYYGRPDPYAAGPTSPGPAGWSPGAGSYGEPAEQTQYTNIDDLMSRAQERPGPGQPVERPPVDEAFAHLFRDQQATPRGSAAPGAAPAAAAAQGPPPAAQPAPAAGPPAAKRPSRAASLLRSSAIMAAGTLVSRLTGFIRQLVTVAALGAAVLGDTYTVAWALPSMIYFLIIGGGLNSVFVPQLVRAMKDDADGGQAYANRLLTLVMAALAGLVAIGMLAAPLLIRLQSPSIADDPAANEVTITFARYFLPTIFFTGVYTVIGQILNAKGYFGAMMWTPVLNNIVVIFTFGMFIWVFGTQSNSHMGVSTITPEGVRLLGVGTLLGLVVQALAMLPYLRAAGFRIRPRFDWRGHGLGKAARLAKWTVLFVFANQAGLIVVTELTTWAGDKAADQGYPGTGFIAYNSTLLIWQMPQAIITVSVMAALLPRLSRSAADGDVAAVRDDLSHGLRTSAVAIVPIAFAFLALGVPMCTLLFGTAGEEGAKSFGYVLMAFGLGLIPYSAQYVVLRAFYAYEDTRTPFYNTVIVSVAWMALSGLSFVLLPYRWVVVGVAFSYGVAYALGVLVAWRRLRARMSTDLDGARVVRTYIRLTGASIPAAALGGLAGFGVLGALGEGLVGSLAALAAGGLVLLALFYVAARRMRVEELTALIGMVRGRLGR